MIDAQLPETARLLANDVLVWIGFGTVVGLLAKAVMPGRDPGGAVATVVMGIGGTIIGCGTLTYFWENGQRVTPISLGGLVVATLGAFILLFFYRLLGGHFFLEGDHVTRVHHRRRRRPSARRRYEAALDD